MNSSTRRTLLIAGLMAGLGVTAAAPAAAQGEGGMASQEGVPEGWLVRFDRPSAGADMLDFEVMEPGWHVTTGRAGAAIFWQPSMTAQGSYTLSATYHLFEPASHAEAFGLFIGGQELDDDDQRYLYFLVRQTGEYLIKRRMGDDTENVVGWTAHEAIPVAPAGEQGPTQYDLGVQVGDQDVEFLVNGTVVHSLPRSDVTAEGLVGLRINHMLNVHVERLTLE